MGRPKLDVKLKVQKELPEFHDEVASLSNEQLDERLAAMAKDMEEITLAKEADDKLEDLRASVLEASAPYRDAKKVISLKTKYVISLLKDRGQA